MWRRFETSSKQRDAHSELGFVELVDMLLRPALPVAFMGAAVTSVGLVLASQKQDVVLVLLSGGAVVVDAACLLVVLAYRRRAAAGPIRAEDAKRWENFYTAGIWGFAAMLGAIELRALTLPFVADRGLTPMLAAGINFVFAGGAGSNVAYRPHQTSVALALATAPTVMGLLYRAAGATDRHAVAGYVLVAALLCGFALAQFQWSRANYETTRRQVLAKLDHALLARRDELTGLANRLQLRERFAEAVARLGSGGDRLAIHCLDLDRFKAVNDSYGHLVGDALLRAVTERLLGAIRHEDMAARLGGDEFVVVQTGVRHEHEALMMAHRIVRALGAPYDIGGIGIRVGVSIGVALVPRDVVTLDESTARADAALYRAKREGRGVVVLSEEEEPRSSLTGP
jgi:diguanylate cyclase (GGDEF)-like protein